MKRLLYFLLLLFVLSCAKGKKEAPAARDMKEPEVEKPMPVTNTTIATTSEAFEYQHLTTQKLQDYVDLLTLQQQHPEFNEGIASQLQKLLKDSIRITKTGQKITIKNVQRIDSMHSISDSVQKMWVRFDMIADNYVKSDSIAVFIKTKKILLDGNEVIATKLVFSKE
jgi:hypothetical protein